MNQDMMHGKWLEIKGEVLKQWGKLTDDELTQTKGDAKAIAGLIQQKYADQKDDYKTKLNGIFQRFSDRKDAAVESAKESLKN